MRTSQSELSRISFSSAIRVCSSITFQSEIRRLLDPDIEVSGVLRSWDIARSRLLLSFSFSASIFTRSRSR